MWDTVNNINYSEISFGTNQFKRIYPLLGIKIQLVWLCWDHRICPHQEIFHCISLNVFVKLTWSLTHYYMENYLCTLACYSYWLLIMSPFDTIAALLNRLWIFFSNLKSQKLIQQIYCKCLCYIICSSTSIWHKRSLVIYLHHLFVEIQHTFLENLLLAEKLQQGYRKVYEGSSHYYTGHWIILLCFCLPQTPHIFQEHMWVLLHHSHISHFDSTTKSNDVQYY